MKAYWEKKKTKIEWNEYLVDNGSEIGGDFVIGDGVTSGAFI
jgi:hypothetical protein